MPVPIDEQFHNNLKPVGKHQEHNVWGPGKQGAAAADEKVKAAYSQAGQNMQPLGIHGTSVAIDWDDCIADGGCLPVCPVAVFEWLQNPGKSGQNDRAGYADKSDPVREDDCIFCMACVTVCPTTAIKIDQSLAGVQKQQPAPAQAPSATQQPAPAPAQQSASAQQPVTAKQPTAQAPAPAQQPAPVQQPTQPIQPQSSAQPATQAPPPPPQPAPDQQSLPQLAMQLTQLAQQLNQLAQELARLAQAQQRGPAQQPAAAPVPGPTQVPAPAQEPAGKPTAPTTQSDKTKKVPDRNLPTN